MTFTVLILICSLGMPPADCQPYNARQVIQGPEAPDETRCGLYGQAFVAGLAYVEIDRERQYIKITCHKTAIGKIVG